MRGNDRGDKHAENIYDNNIGVYKAPTLKQHTDTAGRKQNHGAFEYVSERNNNGVSFLPSFCTVRRAFTGGVGNDINVKIRGIRNQLFGKRRLTENAFPGCRASADNNFRNAGKTGEFRNLKRYVFPVNRFDFCPEPTCKFYIGRKPLSVLRRHNRKIRRFHKQSRKHTPESACHPGGGTDNFFIGR